MAITKTAIELKTPDFQYGGTAYVTTAEDASGINVTFEPAWQCATYVKFVLQRPNASEAWTDVAVKSGESWYDFLEYHPFNTRFNIARSNTTYRIRVEMYDVWNHADHIQTAYSNMFIH
ncbi:hypothetical protein [Ectobacillus panaciterrae]|uniref:hypothetical protein n=1 Tax=Ectobacillus panaciterrae TaxID=363872 RepID=UPI0003F7F616|nr:hypothetical protein [Ectobacillus panaciterrae]